MNRTIVLNTLSWVLVLGFCSGCAGLIDPTQKQQQQTAEKPQKPVQLDWIALTESILNPNAKPTEPFGGKYAPTKKKALPENPVRSAPCTTEQVFQAGASQLGLPEHCQSLKEDKQTKVTYRAGVSSAKTQQVVLGMEQRQSARLHERRLLTAYLEVLEQYRKQASQAELRNYYANQMAQVKADLAVKDFQVKSLQRRKEQLMDNVKKLKKSVGLRQDG